MGEKKTLLVLTPKKLICKLCALYNYKRKNSDDAQIVNKKHFSSVGKGAVSGMCTDECISNLSSVIFFQILKLQSEQGYWYTYKCLFTLFINISSIYCR